MSGADAVRRLADFGRALVLSRTELARSDRLDAASSADLQRRRLEDLVRHAITNLFNRSQHLIRYELSDMVAFDSRPCRCGRTSRRVTSIEGRSGDIVLLPAGSGGQIPIHPLVLRRPFTALPGVHHYKVISDHEGLRVLLVISTGARIEDTTRQVRAAVAAGLEEAGAIPPAIQVEAVASLQRDDGHGARFKLIESRWAAHGRTAEGSMSQSARTEPRRPS